MIREYILKGRGIPRNNYRCRREIQYCRSQRRHVQCLANVAGILMTIRMLMRERAAYGKIKHRRASYNHEEALALILGTLVALSNYVVRVQLHCPVLP